MSEESKRPDVDPAKVAAYIVSLGKESSKYHGEMTIKFHGGNIISVRTVESIDLHAFKRNEGI